jgi:hypothetical protein
VFSALESGPGEPLGSEVEWVSHISEYAGGKSLKAHGVSLQSAAIESSRAVLLLMLSDRPAQPLSPGRLATREEVCHN